MPGRPEAFAIRRVERDEALIDTDEPHLRFIVGVRADSRLLHVTTVVQLKGWRGRSYFLPVRLLHDPVTRR